MPKNTSKTPNKCPKETPKKWPPKGLSFDFAPERTRPFIARWRDAGDDGRLSTKRYQSFADEKSRDEFARDWLRSRDELGKRSIITSKQDYHQWLRFREITGGANPVEVARFWVKHNGAGSGFMSVDDVIGRYPETRSRPMKRHMEKHLKRFSDAFGKRPASEITDRDIQKWANTICTDRTGGASISAHTIADHLRNIRAVWAAATARRWILFDVARTVPMPLTGDGTVNILTVDETRSLFDANRRQKCIGRLALEAFGGLRYTSAARLKREDIVWDESGIVFPGRKHKSGKRHFVAGWPENLFEWVRFAPEECWNVTERIYLELKRDAFDRAGLKGNDADVVKSRRNALRHSFASYYLALLKNQQLTAYLMTKTSLSSLNNDYRGRATNSEAQAYFSILP